MRVPCAHLCSSFLFTMLILRWKMLGEFICTSWAYLSMDFKSTDLAQHGCPEPMFGPIWSLDRWLEHSSSDSCISGGLSEICGCYAWALRACEWPPEFLKGYFQSGCALLGPPEAYLRLERPCMPLWTLERFWTHSPLELRQGLKIVDFVIYRLWYLWRGAGVDLL